MSAPWLPLWLVLAAADAGSVRPPLAVRSRVEPEQVRLGEPFVYEVVATHEKAQRAELVLPPELGPFEVLGNDRQRVDGPDSATTTFRLTLSVFELGRTRVPDLELQLVQEDGQSQTPVPGRAVEAVSSLPQDAEQQGASLYDIRPPREVAVRSWRLLLALAAVLAAAALGYLGYWLWRRRRAGAAAPIVPERPLHDRVIAELAALRAADLPAQGRWKEFYTRLSEILRGYLGVRFGFDALECTSEELLGSLRRLQPSGVPLEELARLTADADLVKFAKATSTPAHCKAALELCVRVVYQTIPQPPAPAPDAGKRPLP